MTLWERELEPFLDRLEQLNPVQRLTLAVTAIEHAYSTEPEPVDEPEEAQCLEGGIRAGQAAVAGGEANITLPPDLADLFNEVADDAPDPGVFALLGAIMICVENDSLSKMHLSEVLYQCYEFMAHRQELDDRTTGKRSAHSRCVISYRAA